MEKRKFGKTGLHTSVLGFGGFHLLEIPKKEADYLLNKYLESGGNYIETAELYGNGDSEEKIGTSVSNRKKDFILTSKTIYRDKNNYIKSLNRSLKRLKTSYIDLHIMHMVGTNDKKLGLKPDDLKRILSPGGALEGAEKAKKDGKIRFIGISMHGYPDTLIEALKNYPFDAVMATINYFDRFNFPEIEKELMPLAIKKQTAIILMKPLADGYLWRSAREAFRYAINQQVSVVVTGINNRKMLKDDIKYVNEFIPMSQEEEEELFKNSVELGNYVCRQCGKCLICPEGIQIPDIFKYEGYYDRQMIDGIIRNPADFALRHRLRLWYGNSDLARNKYSDVKIKADKCTECRECIDKCPYNIDIIQKLKIAHFKLSNINIDPLSINI
ncbi:MAG TPA: aldo/keto reductase [Clostridium sp.]